MEDIEQYLLMTFPKTKDEFDKAGVIQNRLVRSHLVYWMDQMFQSYVRLGQLDYDRILYHSTTMLSSWAKTGRLYEIQTAINSGQMQQDYAVPGNLYYDILFEAHRLWTSITIEFRNIFIALNLINYPEFILQLPMSAPVEIGGQMVHLIATNDNLNDLMKDLTVNSETILRHIQVFQGVALPPCPCT